MKNSGLSRFFGKGRRFVLTLALFVLIFAAASIVKIQAAGNVTGWLWGGSEDGAGNNTGVGWISANNTNQGGVASYGLNIPSSNGNVTGYTWSENIGWVSFNLSDLTGCPQGQCRAVRDGNNIKGWARILGIKDAAAIGNSGGWQGWVSLSGGQYGVRINQDNTLTGYGWSDELGWVDFSRATFAESCALCGSAISQTFCAGSSGPTTNLCAGSGTPSGVSGSGPWNWTCACGGSTTPCTVGITSPEDGRCGTANGGSLCQGRVPTNADLCAGGNSDPQASSLNLDTYEVKWTCKGICSSVNEDCSAKGKKACGWIETNP